MSRQLRTTFDDVAELYEQARPTYPAGLFDDLMGLASLGPRSRVLEIGCGTGKATLELAGRGLRVTCVELGPALAAVARRKLALFPGVEILTADFEAWEPTVAAFDAVVAFTSFHWIDPGLRFAKAAALLREGGALAVAMTHHVLPEDGDTFFRDVQDDYRAVLPDDPKTKNGPPGPPDAVAGLSDDIEASGLFDHVAERRHRWDVEYTADSYIAVLDTYSNHRALDEATRAELYARIRRRIGDRRVRKTYLATLDVATKL